MAQPTEHCSHIELMNQNKKQPRLNNSHLARNERERPILRGFSLV